MAGVWYEVTNSPPAGVVTLDGSEGGRMVVIVDSRVELGIGDAVRIAGSGGVWIVQKIEPADKLVRL